MSSAKRQKLDAMAEKPPWIAILDFGSQYSHLIARRVREANVYCELFSCKVSAAELDHHNLKGVILSGGPNSVYDEASPHVEAGTWEMIRAKKIPLLGICYGMQEIVHRLGGKVAPCDKREYGRSMAKKTGNDAGGLLAGLPDEFQMWMSHGDKLITIPDGFEDLLTTANSEHAAIGNAEAGIWGFQFHPEVSLLSFNKLR
jgi:GMP synthase (glutamine-hydrolysing)